MPTAVTDATGFYRLADVGPGDYSLIVDELCFAYKNQPLVVDGDEVADITLARPRDSLGYRCYVAPSEPIAATAPFALSGDDAVATVALPFPFRFYGVTCTGGTVSTNGLLNLAGSDGRAGPDDPWEPHFWSPNGTLYPYWSDLVVDVNASVRIGTAGAAPTRRFVVEWRNVLIKNTTLRVTVQAVVYEDGRIRFQYLDLPDDPVARGNRAGVAPVWTDARLYPGLCFEFRPPPS